MIVVATGTEKSTEEDKARLLELMGPDAKMISDNDQKALIDAFHEFDADILIAGGRYLYPALKSRIRFLDINHERDFGYEGYDGIVELARQLSKLAPHVAFRTILFSVMYSQQIAPKGAPGKLLPECVPRPFII